MTGRGFWIPAPHGGRGPGLGVHFRRESSSLDFRGDKLTPAEAGAGMTEKIWMRSPFFLSSPRSQGTSLRGGSTHPCLIPSGEYGGSGSPGKTRGHGRCGMA